MRSNSISISANFFPSANAIAVAFAVSSATSATEPTTSSSPVASFSVALAVSVKPSFTNVKSRSDKPFKTLPTAPPSSAIAVNLFNTLFTIASPKSLNA